MSGFCVPADFSLASLNEFGERNATWDIHVEEMYGSLRSSAIGSGRRHDVLPDTDRASFEAYLCRCAELGIEYNYTLNVNCLANRDFTLDGRREMMAHLTELVEAGVTRFTVSLPTIIGMLEQMYPEIPVTVSVISGVDCQNKAEFYCRFSNVKCIYVHEALNRKPELLRQLAQFCHQRGVKVGTLINCSCLAECPQRNHHYNFESHSTCGETYIASGYYGSLCAMEKYDRPSMFLRTPWIRPEEIDRYIELGVDRLKVSGRELFAGGADMLRTVDVYNSRQWEGDLVELFMCFAKNKYSEVLSIPNGEQVQAYLAPFLSGSAPCARQACINCGHCDAHAALVQIDPEARQRWEQKFTDRLKPLHDLPSLEVA